MQSVVRESKPVPHAEDPTSISIIDCDAHHNWSGPKDVLSYLPRYWADYIIESQFKGLPGTPYPKGVNGGERVDARPAPGVLAGSDVELFRRQLLDEAGIDIAILTGSFLSMGFLANAGFAAALSSALNDWMIDVWLGADARFRGSLTVPVQDPLAAAKEIDRLGSRSDIVQVLIAVASRTPYGQSFYDPIWEACERHDLVVGIHFGAIGIMHPPTSVGWPSYYIEWHTNMSQAFQAQMVSMVCEGTFQKFPKLRVAMLEGGFGWVPHVMWRLDKNWKGLRAECPWLDRKPSEIIVEHFRIASQPIEEPENDEHLLQMFDMMHAERTLIFATDYPHWDYDSPQQAFPRLPADLKQRIFVENARELYRL